MRHTPLDEIDSIEITTLQDNYIDVLATDSTKVIRRPKLARPVAGKGLELTSSPQAEHGFSTMVTLIKGDQRQSLLFDFGCSEKGALFNASLLGLDLTTVSAFVLSHGHLDHFGGLNALAGSAGKKNIRLTAHPAVFRENRYMKTPDGLKIYFPVLTRDHVQSAGIVLDETRFPKCLLDDQVIFLGQIPRQTDFETAMPNACFEENGREMPDLIEDDSAICVNVKEKGLVILSGCAHSGIINTVLHAQAVTGVEKVHAVMGGFHLSGPAYPGQFVLTLEAFKKISPDFIIPAHCTGRDATMAFEKAMPGAFILNMSGTTLVFS